MKTPSALSLLIFLAVLSACSSEKSTAPAETRPTTPATPAAKPEPVRRSVDPFPLRSGNYWIYRGQVKWTDAAEPQGVAEATMSWKMEVVGTMNVGKYEVAVMKGHPSDLAWYEKDKPRSDYLIVRDGGKYFRVDGAAVSDATALEPSLDFNSIFLELPPPKGCIARDPEIRRDDTMYCWAAGDAKRIRLESVSGVSPDKDHTAFEFAMRTNPEHAIVTFAPGIGVTSYIYSHHGTVSEVAVKLVEFYAAE